MNVRFIVIFPSESVSKTVRITKYGQLLKQILNEKILDNSHIHFNGSSYRRPQS